MIKIQDVFHGQRGAYEDTLSIYLVISDKGFEATKAHCIKKFGVKNEVKEESSGGYPFGLDSYFWFGEKESGQYTFRITDPYCD